MLIKIWIALLLVSLIGCASGPDTKNQWQSALALEKLGNYEEALANVNSAIAIDPEKEQFLIKKEQLQRLLVAELVASANAILASGLVDINDVYRVSETDQRVKELYPNDPDITIFSNEVGLATSAFYQKSDDALSHVNTLIGNEEWGDAFYKLSDLLQMNPEAKNAEALMIKIRSEGIPSMIDIAMIQLDNEEILNALDTLTTASDIEPSNSEVGRLLDEALGKDSEAYYWTAIENRIGQKEWDKLAILCAASERFDSLITACVDGQAKADYDIQKNLISQIEKLFSERRYIGAFDQFIQAKQIDLPEYDHKMLELGEALGKKMNEAANKMKKKGNYGVAWVIYDRLNKQESQYANLKNLEDKILDRIKKLIAVYDFTSPKDSSDAGIIVANNLISRLFVSSSKDVSILERESLKTILEEMKLAQIGVVSENDSQEMGKIYGIDTAIMGSVLRYRVDQIDNVNRKTARVKVGERIEDNIEYLNWVAGKKNLKNSDLKDAPQAKILVPEYENISYEVKNVKKVGFVELSFRIVDSATGETLKVKTLERTKTFSDSANEGVEMAEVPFDPMDIPTNTEVLKSITESIVDELVSEVLSPIQNMETKYLEDGQRYLKRREYLNAAEVLVDSTFDVKLKSIDNSPVAAKARELIDVSLVNYQF
jgi:tetratricopeptide (TPR) repeat protein